MRLPDGPRQVLAGIVAGAAFLLFFLGLLLVWWLALGLAVAVYFALLLVVGRRRPLEEIQLTARVTAADVAAAAEALADAGRRLARAAEAAPDADRPAIATMAEHVGSIRQSIIEDPEDYRPARSFVNVYLPGIVQTVEGYVKLARQTGPGGAARLTHLGDRIRAFAPAVERIRTACIENDLKSLEIEVSVLSERFDREGGR